MERKTGCMSLILTLNDANKDITDQEAKKAVKRMLSALRDKANRENWSYYIFVGFSRSNQGIKAVRPHFHVFLYAEPCWTVSRWIGFNSKIEGCYIFQEGEKHNKLTLTDPDEIERMRAFIENRDYIIELEK